MFSGCTVKNGVSICSWPLNLTNVTEGFDVLPSEKIAGSVVVFSCYKQKNACVFASTFRIKHYEFYGKKRLKILLQIVTVEIKQTATHGLRVHTRAIVEADSVA